MKSAKRNSNAGKALHRAHEDKEAQLAFNGGQYNVAEVPEVIMNAMQRLTLQVRELQLELEKQCVPCPIPIVPVPMTGSSCCASGLSYHTVGHCFVHRREGGGGGG